MGTAQRLLTLDGQGVGGAVEVAQDALRTVCQIVAAAVVVQPFSAVGTVDQSGQRIGNTGGVDPATGCAGTLGKMPGFRVNNGIMRILEDQPFLRRILYPLILIMFLGRAEVERVPHVFRLGQDTGDSLPIPGIGAGRVQRGLAGTTVALGHVVAGGFDLLPLQRLGDIAGAQPVNAELIDPANDRRGFFVDQPVILVLRIADESIDRRIGDRLPRSALLLEGGSRLAGLVAEIPLVHDVQERGELVAVLILAVDVVGNGDEADVMLPEEYFCIVAGLKVLAAKTAHVLDENRCDLAFLNIAHQLLPCRTVEIAARPAVIGVVYAI